MGSSSSWYRSFRSSVKRRCHCPLVQPKAGETCGQVSQLLFVATAVLTLVCIALWPQGVDARVFASEGAVARTLSVPPASVRSASTASSIRNPVAIGSKSEGASGWTSMPSMMTTKTQHRGHSANAGVPVSRNTATSGTSGAVSSPLLPKTH